MGAWLAGCGLGQPAATLTVSDFAGADAQAAGAVAVTGQPDDASTQPGADTDTDTDAQAHADAAAESSAASSSEVASTNAASSTVNASDVATVDPGPAVMPSSGGEPATTVRVPDQGDHLVGAMVGHIHGRSIYAADVLRRIDGPLRAIAANANEARFRAEARELITSQFQELVVNSLILGDAERSLSDRQQTGLSMMIQAQREELLRLYGQGAERRAGLEIQRRTGRTLEGALATYRERVLISKYMREQVLPRIVVSRREVERHYRDHFETYNQPAGRVVHLIRATDPAVAEAIEARLASGEPFQEVAGDRHVNQYRPDEQGRFPGVVQGQGVIDPEIDRVMLELEAGRYAPRIDHDRLGFVWVYVSSISDGRQRSLRDVQLEIEAELRDRQVRMLTQRYNQELLKRGNFTPIEEMVAAVVEVAVSRYARVASG